MGKNFIEIRFQYLGDKKLKLLSIHPDNLVYSCGEDLAK